MIDLTLRVQPFTSELANALDLDAHAVLFRLNDASQKEIVKAIEFAIAVPNQRMMIFAVPDIPDASLVLHDAEISSVRARTQKDVDGYALIFYASVGPIEPDQLDYICRWHTEQRFITFEKQQAALDFEPPADTPQPSQRRRQKSVVEQRGDVH
jgi:hypothetical protein